MIGAGRWWIPAALVAEIEKLKKAGIDVRGRLFLSDRAHLIFPYHREMDKAAEKALRRSEDWHNFARDRTGV